MGIRSRIKQRITDTINEIDIIDIITDSIKNDGPSCSISIADLQSQRLGLVEDLQKLQKLIASVPDKKARELMQQYYIEGVSWRRILAEHPESKEYLNAIFDNGLDFIAAEFETMRFNSDIK